MGMFGNMFGEYLDMGDFTSRTSLPGVYSGGGHPSAVPGQKLGEYLEMGIYEEGVGFVMKGNVAKPKDAATMMAFKTLQLRINDVLWAHGRGSEMILADGDIGPTTRLRALTVAKYVGGSSYLDMFVQSPSEKLLARYAVEIAVDLARAAPPNAPPVRPTTGIPGMPTGPVMDTPGIPSTGAGDLKSLVQSNAAKMVGLFGVGYLLLNKDKKKRTYKRRRKPAKRGRRRSYKRRSRRR